MMESAGKAFMPIYSDHLNLEQGRGTSILVPLHMEVYTYRDLHALHKAMLHSSEHANIDMTKYGTYLPKEF